jgi:transglutaminase-like putative cysteine protease
VSSYRVVHETKYEYQSKVSSSYGQLCMLPREFPGQRCVDDALVIEPDPHDVRERIDYFGNRVAYFTVQQGHRQLTIRASSEVEVADVRELPDTGPTVVQTVAAIEALTGPDRVTAANFAIDSPRVRVDERVTAYGAESFRPSRPVIEALSDLGRRIHDDFEFDATSTTVNSTIDDLLEGGAGVCQDFAHLAVASLRSQGVPARYVSGYLETLPPPGKAKLVGADVSHAWVSAMIPGLGWVDHDPTNNQFVNGRYITTAWGRDYSDITPVKGVVYSDGGRTKLDVSVDVTRLD